MALMAQQMQRYCLSRAKTNAAAFCILVVTHGATRPLSTKPPMAISLHLTATRLHCPWAPGKGAPLLSTNGFQWPDTRQDT